MIDKVEVLLPPGTEQFTRPVFEIVQALHSQSPEVRFSRSKNYMAVVDLRPITGHDAMLHLHSKQGGTHKIELLDTGEKCRGQMYDTVAEIQNRHPELLSCGRVDLCANVEVGVPWFARSVRARWAQWQALVGEIELQDEGGRHMQFSEMGRRHLQTVYLGKRPNCFRVYDKLAERRSAWSRELGRHMREARRLHGIPVDVARDPDSLPPDWWTKANSRNRLDYHAQIRAALLRDYPFPSFEHWFAAQCTGAMSNVVQMELPGQQSTAEQLSMLPVLPSVLTRVERQMGGGRVPNEISSMEKLFSGAPGFNPFARLEFQPATAEPEIGAGEFSPVDTLAGLMMRQLLHGYCGQPPEWTRQQLYAFLNSGRGRKGDETLKKFASFIADPREYHGSVTAAQLYESYQDTIQRQLAA